jgi:MarR family transcriptional regulator for hemolysin
MTPSVAYLLSDSARLLRRAFDARMRALGVTGPQARLLLVLGLHEGQNQGFYAEQLDVEAITLCRMLDRMEEAGLLERRRDPADRRAWRVHLTAAGQALLPQLRDGVAPMVETMLAGLDPAERERFGHLLEQVRSNLTRELTPEVATHG